MAKSVEQHYGNDGIVERIVGALTVATLQPGHPELTPQKGLKG